MNCLLPPWLPSQPPHGTRALSSRKISSVKVNIGKNMRVHGSTLSTKISHLEKKIATLNKQLKGFKEQSVGTLLEDGAVKWSSSCCSNNQICEEAINKTNLHYHHYVCKISHVNSNENHKSNRCKLENPLTNSTKIRPHKLRLPKSPCISKEVLVNSTIQRNSIDTIEGYGENEETNFEEQTQSKLILKKPLSKLNTSTLTGRAKLDYQYKYSENNFKKITSTHSNLNSHKPTNLKEDSQIRIPTNTLRNQRKSHCDLLAENNPINPESAKEKLDKGTSAIFDEKSLPKQINKSNQLKNSSNVQIHKPSNYNLYREIFKQIPIVAKARYNCIEEIYTHDSCDEETSSNQQPVDAVKKISKPQKYFCGSKKKKRVYQIVRVNNYDPAKVAAVIRPLLLKNMRSYNVPSNNNQLKQFTSVTL